jgi:hypothetical protein
MTDIFNAIYTLNHGITAAAGTRIDSIDSHISHQRTHKHLESRNKQVTMFLAPSQSTKHKAQSNRLIHTVISHTKRIQLSSWSFYQVQKTLTKTHKSFLAKTWEITHKSFRTCLFSRPSPRLKDLENFQANSKSVKHLENFEPSSRQDQKT